MLHYAYVYKLIFTYCAQNDSCKYFQVQYKTTNKLCGLSPHANYTDRAAAAGRRS